VDFSWRFAPLLYLRVQGNRMHPMKRNDFHLKGLGIEIRAV
jgi:hypothetical protein